MPTPSKRIIALATLAFLIIVGTFIYVHSGTSNQTAKNPSGIKALTDSASGYSLDRSQFKKASFVDMGANPTTRPWPESALGSSSSAGGSTAQLRRRLIVF